MMIHWHEGLHLLPQHLQALQNLVLSTIGAERAFLHRHLAGIVDLELEIRKTTVAVRRLRAVMPGGVLLEYPHNVEIPALDVEAELRRRKNGFRLALGLPAWSPHRANAPRMGDAAGGLGKIRYRLEELSLPDENLGGEGRPAYIRKFNARLLTESDDTSDLEVLPLARIEPIPGTGLPQVDRRFCPPLLRLKGWPPLHDLVRKAYHEIDDSRSGLIGGLLEGGLDPQFLKMHGTQWPLLLKLRSVNSHLARLKPLLEADQASPFEIFCEFQALLGELASLDPENSPFEPAGYRHEQPYDSFEELVERIRRHLKSEAATSLKSFELRSSGDGQSSHVTVPPTEFSPASNCYLFVDCKESQPRVDDWVQDRWKCVLTTLEEVSRPDTGLMLRRCEVAPGGLPRATNFHYYSVDRNSNPRIWDAICKQGEIGLRGKPPFECKRMMIYLG